MKRKKKTSFCAGLTQANKKQDCIALHCSCQILSNEIQILTLLVPWVLPPQTTKKGTAGGWGASFSLSHSRANLVCCFVLFLIFAFLACMSLFLNKVSTVLINTVRWMCKGMFGAAALKSCDSAFLQRCYTLRFREVQALPQWYVCL